MLEDYELFAFYWKFHLIWFCSHKEISIFVRYFIVPSSPSFDQWESRTTQWRFHTPFELFMYHTKVEGKGLLSYLTKIKISLWLQNQMGWFFCRDADHIQINSQYWSYWCWKSNCIFFWGGGGVTNGIMY